MKDLPIVSSRLQKDWYYVTQQFFAWLKWRDIRVRYHFINRNFPKIRLAERIDLGQLREEIEHVKTLFPTQEEIDWLRAKFHENQVDGFLTDEFLAWYQTSRLPDVHIDEVSTPDGKKVIIEPFGFWHETMDWETFILPIVTHLYARTIRKQHQMTEREVLAETMFRLGMKIAILKQHPTIRIGSFGLRRQYSFEHSRLIDERLIREIPDQLVGISNVWMAKLLDWPVIGTFAHQNPMCYAAMAIARGEDDAGVRASHMQFFDDWAGVFPRKWLTAVSDTFGSESFFEDFGSVRATYWDNYKQDSGDPCAYALRLEAWFKSLGIDPNEKVLNPTDALDLKKMLQIDALTQDKFKATVCGVGTNLSNDTGLPTAGSFVVKPDEVFLPDGRSAHAVKLSDNLEKASGNPETIKRMQRVHRYKVTERTECIV